MAKKRQFDVFLSHNRKDLSAIERLANELKARGLAVWLDKWELEPGKPWQEALEKVIETTKAAAVLVGKDGLGPWQNREMRALLSAFVDRHLRVIPVLLPGAKKKPRLPLFLCQLTWVDLRGGVTPDGLDELEWGITGKKPTLRVVHSDVPPAPMNDLLQSLEEALTRGSLRDSAIGPEVLAALREEPRLKSSTPRRTRWITTGVRLSDEYFVRVWQSAGQRDWQRDFAKIAAPALVGVARSLARSPAAQALVIRLCETLATRLRLSLVWPKDPDESNDLENAIYRACLQATEVESDQVLVELQGLTVIGPK